MEGEDQSGGEEKKEMMRRVRHPETSFLENSVSFSPVAHRRSPGLNPVLGEALEKMPPGLFTQESGGAILAAGRQIHIDI